MKRFLMFALVAGIAGGIGWFAARRVPQGSAPAKSEKSGEPKIAFYQSSMHPWIKSDKPGNCTICGMKLSPVYEGEKGYEADAGVVHLSSNSIAVLHVEAAPIVKAPLRRTLRLAGTIDDDDTKHRFISAFIPGRIEKLYANFVGAEVKAGEPLAAIFSPELLTAEREYASLARGNANSDLLQAAALRLRRMGLTEAQINALPEKDPNLAITEIVAPAAGTIINRFVYEGQYVMEGEKLFETADFSTMWFQANVYERDLPWVSVGQTVRVTTPSVAGREFEGKIVFINPNMDEMSRSAVARVELENPIVGNRRLLLHKLYAEGALQIETEPVLQVARRAVLNPGGQPLVYIDLGAGGFERREVKLGRRGDEAWEVLEGLEAEERVVTEGNLMIDSQAQVEQSQKTGAPAAHDHSTPASAPGATPAAHNH